MPHSASLVIKPNFRHAAKGEGCVRFRVCVLAHGCLFNPTRHLQHGHFPFSPTSNPPPHSTFPILCSSSFSPTRKIDYRGVDDGFERDEVKIQREMRNFSNRMTIVSRLKGDGNCALCLNYVIRVTIDRQRSILEARLERNFDRKGERVGEQVLLARIYLLNDPQLSSNINGNLVGGNGRKKFVEKHGKIFPSFVRTNFHQDRIIPLWERSIKHCPYFLKLVNKKVVRTFTLAQGNDPKIKPVISVQRFSLWDSLQRISRKREWREKDCQR